MNRIFFRTMALLIAAIFIFSCNKDDYSTAGFVHNLHICVQDKSGNDRIAGIEADTVYSENDYWGGFIKEQLFSLYVTYPKNKNRMTFSGRPVDKIPRTRLEVAKWGDALDNYHFLHIGTGTSTRITEIAYKLTCPYIFGDNAEHTITSYWKLRSGTSSLFYDCTRIKMDGKEFPVTQEPFFPNPKADYVSTVRVVLDN